MSVSYMLALIFIIVMLRARILFENIDGKTSYLTGMLIGIVYGILLTI